MSKKTSVGYICIKLIDKIKLYEKRGRDIPNSLTHLADKHANDLAEEMGSHFSDVEKHQLRHREVCTFFKFKFLFSTFLRFF